MEKKRKISKSSSQCEIHPSALGGCRLAVCQGQGQNVGVEYLQRNIQRNNAELCRTLPVRFFLCNKESATFMKSAELKPRDSGARYIRSGHWSLNIRNDQNAFCLQQLSAGP